MRAEFGDTQQRRGEIRFRALARREHRRLNELAPFQRAELLVHCIETGEKAGRRRVQFRFALRVDRRDFAEVERPNRAALRVEVDEKSTASNAARLRLRDSKNQCNRDRRINRVAAAPEDVETGARRDRRGRRERSARCGDLRTGDERRRDQQRDGDGGPSTRSDRSG